MIKMIFTDMDGTLLDDNGNLPPDFDATMARLKERGCRFCPASGRQYTALVSHMMDYFDDFAFISENGTCAFFRGEELFSYPIPGELVRQVARFANELPGAYPVLCAPTVAYVTEKWRPYTAAMDKFFTHHEFVDDLEQVVDDPEKYGHIVKIATSVAAGGTTLELTYPVLRDRFEPELQVIHSSDFWTDIQMPGYNKGKAAIRMAEKFGIKAEECAAFGDFMNDFEMVRDVGMGVAVENAYVGLKEVADYIAPPNYEYGVTRTINKWLDEGLI